MRQTITCLDDIQVDIGNLAVFLDVITGKVQEIRSEVDGARNRELDEAAALIWIARDMAERMSTDIDGNFASINGTSISGKKTPAEEPPTKIIELVDRYFRHQRLYRDASSQPQDPSNVDDIYAAFDEACTAIIKQPCDTLAEVRAKATFLLMDENAFQTVNDCRIGDEPGLKHFLRSLAGENA